MLNLEEIKKRIEDIKVELKSCGNAGDVADVMGCHDDWMMDQILSFVAEVETLSVKLNTAKNDYWFMANLLERSSDKYLKDAVKDCIERMKFRKPMFDVKVIAESKPWFGKLIFTREGVEQYHKFATEAESIAYVQGVNDAKDITIEADDDPLDEYQAVHDQLEPVDE